MQIKKCQWINKPENVKIFSSKSLTFNCVKSHALFHTFCENGTLTLSWENDENVKIYALYLNTDIEHIAFEIQKDKIVKHLKIQDITTFDTFDSKDVKNISIEKNEDTLKFLIDGKMVSTFKRENIKASVSLGLAAIGSGKVTFTFVFSPF